MPKKSFLKEKKESFVDNRENFFFISAILLAVIGLSLKFKKQNKQNVNHISDAAITLKSGEAPNTLKSEETPKFEEQKKTNVNHISDAAITLKSEITPKFEEQKKTNVNHILEAAITLNSEKQKKTTLNQEVTAQNDNHILAGAINPNDRCFLNTAVACIFTCIDKMSKNPLSDTNDKFTRMLQKQYVLYTKNQEMDLGPLRENDVLKHFKKGQHDLSETLKEIFNHITSLKNMFSFEFTMYNKTSEYFCMYQFVAEDNIFELQAIINKQNWTFDTLPNFLIVVKHPYQKLTKISMQLNLKITNENDSMNKNLIAMAVFIGKRERNFGAKYGHYYCLVHHENGWQKRDDSRVTKIEEKDLDEYINRAMLFIYF